MVPIICVLDCNYLKNVLLLQIYTPWPVVIQISQVSVFFFSNLPAYNYMRGRSGKVNFLFGVRRITLPIRVTYKSLFKISLHIQPTKKMSGLEIWTLCYLYRKSMRRLC